MADELTLARDFPAADEAAWRALVDKALEGAAFETLVSRTAHGLPVQPLYRETDWASARDASGAPGAAPFTRGLRADHDPALPWDIRARITHPDPAVANARALEALAGGASSLAVVVDPAGARGVALASRSDLERALEGVDLAIAAVALDAPEGAVAGAEPASWLAALAAERGPATRVALGIDPFSRLALGVANGAEGPLAQALELAAGPLANHAAATVLRADARVVHEAGGTEVQELAYLAAATAALMRGQILAGASPLMAARALRCTLAVGCDYLVELAKLRAARRMVARVLGAFGADAAASGLTIEAVSSRRMLTRRDPWTNILRATAACFAAGVGGADVVTARGFTDALGEPGPLARRLARGTQLIAQEESHLGRVIDPAGGAWAVERLADDIARAAWEMFQSIESDGGLAAALAGGEFQRGIADARAAMVNAVARRTQHVTGVTDFPLLGEETPSVEHVWSDPPAPAGPHALAPLRLAEPFERLRDLADARRAEGRPPAIFLACLGPAAEHGPRLGFAQNLFAAGGIETPAASGGAAELAAAFRGSGLALACLCGTDKRYAAEAAGTAAALVEAGARGVWLAGRPGATETEWRAAGVTHFVHLGQDAAAELAQLHAALAGA